MKKILHNKINFLALVITLFLVGGMVSTASAQVRKKPVLKKAPAKKPAPKPVVKYYSIPVGEVIHVKMNETLSSKTAKIGDTFTTRTVEPVYGSTGAL